MKELDLHNQFMAYLRKHGYAWFRSRMDKRTSTKQGDPDFVVVKNGRVAFVEMKLPKGKVSPAQELRFTELNNADCVVCVARSLEEAVAHVQEAFEHSIDYWGPIEKFTRYLDCIGGENGKVAVEQFYLASSRDIGTVVVRYEPDGREVFVRVANKHDQLTLPPAP